MADVCPPSYLLADSRRAIAIARHRDDPFGIALARSHLAGALFDLGEFPSACNVLDPMEADLALVPLPRRNVVGRRAAAYRLELAADQEDAEAATAAIASLEAYGPMEDPRSEPWARAREHFASRRYGEALAAIEAVRAQPYTGDDHGRLRISSAPGVG